MKIFVTSLPDLKRISVQRSHHLLSRLSRRHEVQVLCVEAWWLPEKTDDYLKKTLANFPVHYVTPRKVPSVMQEVLASLRVGSELNRLSARGVDVHLNFNSLIMGYSFARALKRRGAISVFDICDDLRDWIQISPQVPSLLKPIGRSVAGALYTANIRASSRVTYTTPSLFDSPQGLTPSRYFQIENGVDTGFFFKKPGQELRTALGVGPGDLLVGYLGELHEWVDFGPVFSAASSLITSGLPLKILIVGSGPTLPVAQKTAQDLGCAGSCIFTGHIPYEKVPDYISAMDIGLIPFSASKVSANALPLKLFEYLACEKPVVSTLLTGVREAVRDLVSYYSGAEELRQRILSLADLEERNRQGAAGRLFTQERFSWDDIARRFERVLEDGLKRRSGGGLHA